MQQHSTFRDPPKGDLHEVQNDGVATEQYGFMHHGQLVHLSGDNDDDDEEEEEEEEEEEDGVLLGGAPSAMLDDICATSGVS